MTQITKQNLTISGH